MPSLEARRAQAKNASSGADHVNKLFAETLFAATGAAPTPPGAEAVSDALARNAISRASSSLRKETVRLIDLERRARFGRCGFGTL